MRRFFGLLLLLIGLVVFAVRAQHEGPYVAPEGGNLVAGVLALVIGAWFFFRLFEGSGFARLLNWVGGLAMLPVLFFSAYAIMSELEEVVSLFVADPSGGEANLRLWIVDHEGSPWVTMGADKADRYNLSGQQADLLRAGTRSCVQMTRYDEREIVNTIHRLRTDKYAVQRFAIQIGMFGDDANPTTVALQLKPCDAG